MLFKIYSNKLSDKVRRPKNDRLVRGAWAMASPKQILEEVTSGREWEEVLHSPYLRNQTFTVTARKANGVVYGLTTSTTNRWPITGFFGAYLGDGVTAWLVDKSLCPVHVFPQESGAILGLIRHQLDELDSGKRISPQKVKEVKTEPELATGRERLMMECAKKKIVLWSYLGLVMDDLENGASFRIAMGRQIARTNPPKQLINGREFQKLYQAAVQRQIQRGKGE